MTRSTGWTAARTGRHGHGRGRAWLGLIAITIAALGVACGRPVPMSVLTVQGANQRGFSWALLAGAEESPFRDPAQEAAARREHVRGLVERVRDAQRERRRLAEQLRQARDRARETLSRPAARGRRRDVILVSDTPGQERNPGPGLAWPGRAAGRRDDTAARWRRHLPRGMRWATGARPIQGELVRAAPWLRRLSNGEDIIALYTVRIAWQREARVAQAQAEVLPDPARTIVSREKRARARRRAPWDERRRQALAMLRELPNNTRIRLSELRADDFIRGATFVESGARLAMLFAIDRHRGSVGLDPGGGATRVHVYIDGTRLPLQGGRLRFEAFFGTTAVALLEVQEAYHAAVIENARMELGYLHRKYPDVAGQRIEERFEDLIGAQVLARLDQGGGTAEQRVIDEMRQERLGRARAIRARTAAAMVPLTVIVSLFAVEGASELFLQAFPLGKAAGAIKEIVALRRAGKAARELEKLPALAGLRKALGAQQGRFLRGIGKLGVRQRRALLAIGAKVNRKDGETYPDVMIKLMEGAARGHADLRWIESKLRKGHFDGAFVRNFTRYDANPTWRELKMLLNNTIAPATRRSLVSKLSGFRGEEAAAALVHEPGFRRRFFQKGTDYTVSRGDGSLDLVVRAEDNSAIVFSEVKNWSAAGWLNPAERAKVREQLRMHEERIEDILGPESQAVPPGGVHKLLMVAKGGWRMLGEDQREEFVKEIRALGGWQIQIIPSSMIESSGQLIDRLRRPASK